MREDQVREAVIRWSRSLFERRFTVGSSGNISVRLDDGYIVTPTNSCLGFLEAASLSRLDLSGAHLSGDAPSKELPLHLAFYEARPAARAVVHLHSTYATALSCLADVDQADALAPITPYAVMRLGKVPVIAYRRPGSPDIAPLIREKAADHSAVLLANHGPVVAGPSLEAAIYAIEELEETAKLLLLTESMKVRHLDAGQIAELEQIFKLR
jgi:ribulose-5-phosphate 4-epimerase/fuculose-1-phosphate aldolase